MHEIDLQALFFRIFKVPTVQNLDLQVKMHSAKKLPQGKQILQRPVFKFH